MHGPTSFPSTTPLCCSLILSEPDFRKWFDAAPPGSSILYHRGHLAVDRVPRRSRLKAKDASELDRLARSLLSLAEAGAGHLFQKRHGFADRSYLFVAAVLPAGTIAVRPRMRRARYGS